MIDWQPLTLLAQATRDTADVVADAVGEKAAAAAIDAVQVGQIKVEEVGSADGWQRLIMALAVLVVPVILAFLIANGLKLKDKVFPIWLCLAAAFAGLGPFAWHAVKGDPLSESIRQGIDLAGGTNLVYQAVATPEKPITSSVMENMVMAVGRRINPSGTEEVTVRQVGSDRIEVIIPGADPAVVERKKKQMTKLGSLEFGIMATERFEPDIVRGAKQLSDGQRDYRSGGRVVARWTDVGSRDGVRKFIDTGGAETRIVDINGEKTPQFLLLRDPEKELVTGEYLRSATPDFGQNGLIVRFRFNQSGAYLFQRLTSRFQPARDGSKRRLAVLLDGQIHSAPSINAVISEEGYIEGDFTKPEIDELASVLNAGALQVPLKPEPISEATLDPTLGEDVRTKGFRAIVIAGISVVVFMLAYYRFAGLVAVMGLLLNLILVMGTMVFINATFTLPGLAGLVLTIGMAVDANVLIFERIREERRRGASLRMAIQNGFDRAFTTIVDANVTTLITAVILYMIGTDQIRGFAVTLFIGIVMSMFTALYFGRLVFDIAERKRWITDLKMTSIVGETNWDFVGKRHIAAVFSAIVITCGLVAFFSRGTENYDIDFTGGVMVTFQFEEPQEIEPVRQKLIEKFGPAVTVERLTLAGQDTGSGSNHYRLRVPSDPEKETEAESAKVRTDISETFADGGEFALLKVTMDYSRPEKIPGAPEPETAEEGENSALENLDPFAGGQQVEISFSREISAATITDTILDAIRATEGGAKYDSAELIIVEGTSGSGTDVAGNQVRMFDKVELQTAAEIAEADVVAALDSMQAGMSSSPLFGEVNSFASSVASEMKRDAILAIVISLIAIVAYIWIRFQRVTFGLAAVAALVHDVLVVVGMVAIASYLSGNPISDLFLLNDFRINLPMIAAFLTIVGYSLNDTIVVFDRIREVRGKNPDMTETIVNTSLNQTLSRTLLTSITTFIVVLILYFLGGEGIHGFAFCLVLGVIVGTYSSIFVASPVLLWLMSRGNKSGVAAPVGKVAVTAGS
jgi:SecD/SecF fusion protein